MTPWKDVYICSYPKSGNTLCRYLIELVTGLPTQGAPGSGEEDRPLLYPPGPKWAGRKRHRILESDPPRPIILLLRDPREVAAKPVYTPPTYTPWAAPIDPMWVTVLNDAAARWPRHVILYEHITKQPLIIMEDLVELFGCGRSALDVYTRMGTEHLLAGARARLVDKPRPDAKPIGETHLDELRHYLRRNLSEAARDELINHYGRI